MVILNLMVIFEARIERVGQRLDPASLRNGTGLARTQLGFAVLIRVHRKGRRRAGRSGSPLMRSGEIRR